ncbi:putative ABC transport system permease protein [Sesbania bispinosa]|nr:putative ABC transport system permease protein [Sesbania bispinosa]
MATKTDLPAEVSDDVTRLCVSTVETQSQLHDPSMFDLLAPAEYVRTHAWDIDAGQSMSRDIYLGRACE